MPPTLLPWHFKTSARKACHTMDSGKETHPMTVGTYITKGCIEQASHNVAVAVSQVLRYVAQQQRQGHQRQEVLQVHQDGVVRQSGATLYPQGVRS